MKSERQINDHFGLCPECRGEPIIVSYGRDHWATCAQCRTRWYIGSNLFDAWRSQTPEEKREDGALLSTYRNVEEFYLPLLCAQCGNEAPCEKASWDAGWIDRGRRGFVCPRCAPEFPDLDDYSIFEREHQARAVLTAEIQWCFAQVIPGISADERLKKAELLERCFGTRAWTAVENMPSEELRTGLSRLKATLGMAE